MAAEIEFDAKRSAATLDARLAEARAALPIAGPACPQRAACISLAPF